MTPFPAQWHHLAVQDSLHFPSYSRCSPPAHFLFTALWELPPWSVLWLHKHPQTALTVRLRVHLSLSPTFFLILSLHASPSVFLPLPRSSLFSPPHCVRRWQLRSSGALRGAEKTKIWFSGSDLDFLQIGWKIRRSFYSYSTQSLPLQLQTMTADHRGCSYQHKCAICDKASLCFLPKTMTSEGTQCTEHRSQRNWCEMQDGEEGTMQCT